MIMFISIGELKNAIENINDDYKLELSVDNGIDGKTADNEMYSNSPIRMSVWDESKTVCFSGSKYTSY